MAEQGVTEITVEGAVSAMYTKLEPLMSDRHSGIGLKKSEQALGFARKMHWCPTTVTEMMAAGLSYPLVFSGDEKRPIAVMGLRDGHNVFFNDSGLVNAEDYVPGFFRRYPFALATGPKEEEKIVCIDTGSPLVTSDNPDLPLYDGTEPSQYLQDSVKFLQAYDADWRRTKQFVEMMKELDLFELKSVNYRGPDDGPDGPSSKLADYFAITPEKMAKLSAAKLAELRDNGALQVIYAHQMSLINWQKVIGRAIKAQKAN